MAEDRSIISTDYPYLPIRVEVQGVQLEGRALLDTGYTGEFIIPQMYQQVLGDPIDYSDLVLGNNQPVENVPWYLGTLEIVGLPENLRGTFIQVIGDEYIIGRGILDLFEATFDHGQRVVVKP